MIFVPYLREGASQIAINVDIGHRNVIPPSCRHAVKAATEAAISDYTN